jgi:hypothetical protein
VWFWIPLTILIIGVSSIPSGIGFALSAVVFIYLVRGVEHVERLRSEAVFGLRIAVPPRRTSPYTGLQRWLHQLWLDVNGARFWKATAHHYLRMAYDMLAAGIALALLVFAFLGPAAAIAIRQSDHDAGLSFMSPPPAFLSAFVAVAGAAAILVFAPAVDAVIDRWLLSPSPTAALAQTKLDTDLPAAKQLIAEAHDGGKNALVELRNVVRGIAPTILSDRGLDAALSAVVQRSQENGVPTTLNVHLPQRLPDEVESVAYFVVAEALTSIAKHANATQAVVTVRLDESANRLHVSVFDDGRGGASITTDENVTGMRGLEERVWAAHGTFTVSSPATGSTSITAVLPCAS